MTEEELERDPLSRQVIGAAIEVHKTLGPGLLESAYQECLGYEMTDRGIVYRAQVVMPIVYKGRQIKNAYRLDFVVHNPANDQDLLIIELKARDRTQEIHEAQILTYLKMSGIKRGLLINFQMQLLKLGIRRFVF
jgi:GxxExxY protein